MSIDWGREQSKAYMKVESIATVQVTDDGLDKGGSRRGGEKWSHSGYITKVESMGFPNLSGTKFL